jgi:hypothetical protein
MSASSSTTSQTHRCPSKCVSSVILQLVDTPKGEAANRSHVDISIDDVGAAIGQIEAIGGSVKKQPSLYPRPGSFGGEVPLIDGAVIQGPFGNEFCLVSPLSDDEVAALVAAVKSGATWPPIATGAPPPGGPAKCSPQRPASPIGSKPAEVSPADPLRYT